MHIVFLCTHFNVGGITSSVIQLAESLADRKIEVSIISSGGNAVRLLKNVNHYPLFKNTKSELGFKMLFNVFQLKKFLKQSDVDLVHSHTRMTHMVGYLATAFTTIIWVTTIHGFFKPHLGRRILPLWGDHTISISQAVCDDLKKHYHKTKHVSCIYHGIKIPSKITHSLEFRKELKIPENHFVIGCIARLSVVKGQIYLLKALKEIPSRNWTLLLVGDGPDKEILQNYIKENMIQRDVRLIDKPVALESYYSILDVCIAPSLQEGFGLTVLEAASYKVPVIASNVGGIPEVLSKDEAELVPAANIDRLQQSIQSFLEDPTLLREKSKKAYQKFLSQFQIDTMLSSYIGLYTKLIEKEL